MSKEKPQGFATRAIHAGQPPDPSTGAITTPIYQTSTYVQQSPGVHKGFDYARSINPTRLAYERCVADLENGARGFAFASGLAGMATVLELLDSGAHTISSDDLYGGTFRLFERVRRRSASLDFTFLDLTDLSHLKGAIKQNTRMIWVETPSNPLLKLIDLEGVARFAAENQLLSVCDNNIRQSMDPATARSRIRHRAAFERDQLHFPVLVAGRHSGVSNAHVLDVLPSASNSRLMMNFALKATPRV